MPHIHEKIDFTVDVFVVYKGKVLIRKHDKYDKWLAVGGHIELDENPNQAAIREVKEEAGLDVVLVGEAPIFGSENNSYKELISPRYMNIHDINPTHKHISLIYFAKSNSDKVIDEGREQSKGYKWFSMDDLKQNVEGISESILFYATKALENLSE
ncbi:MAG: NUDIX domain-containing protein [Candidatus Zambryskibacteria bacterium]|nr:NUDIX domain-containing protein [Candidatus Zambryskibacteria bacterium]